MGCTSYHLKKSTQEASESVLLKACSLQTKFLIYLKESGYNLEIKLREIDHDLKIWLTKTKKCWPENSCLDQHSQNIFSKLIAVS